MLASIIICTRNRAESLHLTLEAIGRLVVPAAMQVELVVVDNGSTDRTAEVCQSAHLQNMRLQYVREPGKGKGYAYNAGMASATGQVLVFTDDDVRPPSDWIEKMCRPIVNGEADAVAGGVRIASHLERPWLKGALRGWVACTDGETSGSTLVGANMAFSKKVLERVPAFDTELGPGALGFADDSMFSRQLVAAGYRIRAAPEVAVEHHFDEGRLNADAFMDMARRLGRSHAYVAYHWEHGGLSRAVWQLLTEMLAGVYRWVRGRHGMRSADGIWNWKLDMTWRLAFIKQYLHELRHPRKYEKHGLVKQGNGQ